MSNHLEDTIADKIKTLQCYKSGEWFTASQVAASMNMCVKACRSALSSMKDELDFSAGGNPRKFRKRGYDYPILTKPWRSEWNFGESNNTPKYY